MQVLVSVPLIFTEKEKKERKHGGKGRRKEGKEGGKERG